MISDSVSDNVRQMALKLSETRAVEPDDKDVKSNTIDLTETADVF